MKESGGFRVAEAWVWSTMATALTWNCQGFLKTDSLKIILWTLFSVTLLTNWHLLNNHDCMFLNISLMMKFVMFSMHSPVIYCVSCFNQVNFSNKHAPNISQVIIISANSFLVFFTEW